ncbi:hypothetical protein Q3G72_024674 [Acer saccharum]|nr:hypothetical protein Q3G72_024674 [Acer saccharum]
MEEGVPQNHHEQQAHDPNQQEQQAFEQEVVEEEVEKVEEPDNVPKQVRVLDHSTKVEVDNVEKGTKNENGKSCGGKSVNFKVDRPKGSQVDACLVLEAPKLRKKRSRVFALVQAFEGISNMKKGNHDCLNEQEAIELEEDDSATRTFEEIGRTRQSA